jgi:secondary thiamine-phosphate synthase enzyme
MAVVAVNQDGWAAPAPKAAHGRTNAVLSPPPAPYAPPLRVATRLIQVATERHLEFVDVTDYVEHCLAESGIREGFAVVFSRHTTAGIRINEHEPLLLEDMAQMLEQLAPQDARYRHDDFTVRTVNLTDNERINGHSHCRSLLLGASECIPVGGGRLLLGRWQRIFLVELDGPAQRELMVQIVGG